MNIELKNLLSEEDGAFVSREPVETALDDAIANDFDDDAVRSRLATGVPFWVTPTIKAVDVENRIVEGYASTKAIDRVGEIILPSAYKSSLGRINAKKVKLLFEHMPPAIGLIIKGKIDKVGLWIRARLFETARALEALELVEAGGLDSFSVGFRPIEQEYKTIDGRRVLVTTDLDLYETSLVTIPANIEAAASLTKSVIFGADTFTKNAGVWQPVAPRTEQGSLSINKTPAVEENDTEYKSTLEYLSRVNESFDEEIADNEMKIALMKIKGVNTELNKG